MAANPPGAPPPPPPPPPTEATPTTSLTPSSQSNPGLSGVNSTTRSPMEPKPSSMSPTAKPAKPRYKDIISSNYRQGSDNQYPSDQNRCDQAKGAMWPHASSSGVKGKIRSEAKGSQIKVEKVWTEN
ncbi:uncharacterized protein [Amphiura filiformis]|uniref:uncharacterized protein n=1 Tax=Amphiura filiformis TaxID=82378 RepID=UPI003B210079